MGASKRLFTKVLGLFACTLLLCTGAQATHLIGGSIFYRHLGNQGNGLVKYEITIKIYRENNTVPVDPTIPLGFYESSNFANMKDLVTTEDLPLISDTLVKPPKQPRCSTQGQTPFEILELVYRGDVFLPDTNTTGFHVLYSRCCRNNGTTNLANAGSEGLCYYAYIPRPSIINSSPMFDQVPIPVLCLNKNTVFLNTAVDQDGQQDSIVYSFSVPYSNGYTSQSQPSDPPTPTVSWPITDVVYAGGYNVNSPFGSTGLAVIDNQTGITQFKIPNQGYYAVAVEVREYRNGVLIGIVRRELQMYTDENCLPGTPPCITDQNGGSQYTYYIEEGASVCTNFKVGCLQAGDPVFVQVKGDIFKAAYTAPHPPATAPDTIGGFGPNPVTINFCWATKCGQGRAQPYPFQIIAYGGCNPDVNSVFVDVVVVKPTVKFNGKTAVCRLEKSLTYTIEDTANLASYEWTITNGSFTSPPSGKTVTVDWNIPVGQSGKISVKKTNRFSCTAVTDLIVGIDNRITIAVLDSTPGFCPGTSKVIGLSGSPISGYNYSWTGGPEVNTLTTPTADVTFPNTTPNIITRVFTLNVDNGQGCTGSKNISVKAYPVPDSKIPATTEACSDDVFTMGPTRGAGHTYKWTPSTGFIDPDTTMKPRVKLSAPTGTVTQTYTLTATANGCTSSSQGVVKVYPTPSFTIEASNDSICKDGQSRLKASRPGSQYEWFSIVSPSVLPVGSGDSIIVSPSVTSTYLCVGTEPVHGCRDSATIRIVVRVSPSVSIMAPATSVCLNDSIALDGAGAKTYRWSKTDNTVVFSTNTGVMVSPSVTTTYVVTGTDNFGCQNTASREVIVKPLPVVVVGAVPDSICTNTTTTVGTGGGIAWRWEDMARPGVEVSSAQQFSRTLQTTTSYIVTVTGQNFCKNTAIKVVTVLPIPPVTIITLSDSVCKGSDVKLIASGGDTYKWFQGSTQISSQTSIDYVANAAATYILEGVDIYFCKQRDTMVINVRNNPVVLAQTVPINPNPIACPGDTIDLRSKGARTYVWYIKQNPEDSLISYDSLFSVNPFTSTTYLTIGTDRYGCTGTSSIAVKVNPKPNTGRITGPQNVCPGAKKIRFHIPGGSSTSVYQWSVSDVITFTGQGNDTIQIDFYADRPIVNITVRETNSFGCKGDTLYYQVSLKANYTPPAPSGPKVLCFADAQSVVYAVPFPSSGATYKWFVNNGVVLGPDDQSSVTIRWFVPGTIPAQLTYQEISTTADTACYFTSATLNVIVNPTPNSDISGDLSVCKGDIFKEYSMTGSTSSKYSWGLNPVDNGAQFVSDTTGKIVLISWAETGAYIITATETSSEGCKGPLRQRIVVVNPLPEVYAVDGKAIVCKSELSQKYSIVPVGNPDSRYVWTVTNGNIAAGQGTGTLTVNWNSTEGPAQITVYEISKDSCSGKPFPYDVMIDGTDSELQQVTTVEKDEYKIELHWPIASTVGQLAEYFVERRERSNGANPFTQLNANPISVPSYLDIGLNTDTKIFEYRYSTTDACGGRDYSQVMNTILLTADSREEEKVVNLKWNQYRNWNNGVFTYHVYRKLDGEQEFKFYADAVTDTSVTYTNGTDGFHHTYRIKALERGTDFFSWSNHTEVEFEHALFIPNTFTPNNDGTNDKWVIRSLQAYGRAKLEVFNRWGQKVYETENYQNDWSGVLSNGKDVPDGVYYYILLLSTENGKKEFSGTVTILR